jgi:ssDNA-binding Zn-finger/Zn-ribbon topoisomerase 1
MIKNIKNKHLVGCERFEICKNHIHYNSEKRLKCERLLCEDCKKEMRERGEKLAPSLYGRNNKRN